MEIPAERAGVQIRHYNVIYGYIDENVGLAAGRAAEARG